MFTHTGSAKNPDVPSSTAYFTEKETWPLKFKALSMVKQLISKRTELGSYSHAIAFPQHLASFKVLKNRQMQKKR